MSGGGKILNLIGFTAWNDENYSLIGDFEDEHLTEDEIEWKNYEEEIMAWEVTVNYLRHHGIKFSGIYHQEGKYGEEPDDSFQWKNDPLTKSIVERYMKGCTSI